MSIVSVFALSLVVGCGEKKETKPSVPTYSDIEATADLASVENIEKDLGALGYRFSIKQDGFTKTINWDQSSLANARDKKQAVERMSAYVRAARQFVGKYQVPFNLAKSDGSVEMRSLKANVKQEFELKIDLCQKTINVLVPTALGSAIGDVPPVGMQAQIERLRNNIISSSNDGQDRVTGFGKCVGCWSNNNMTLRQTDCYGSVVSYNFGDRGTMINVSDAQLVALLSSSEVRAACF